MTAPTGHVADELLRAAGVVNGVLDLLGGAAFRRADAAAGLLEEAWQGWGRDPLAVTEGKLRVARQLLGEAVGELAAKKGDATDGD